MPQTISKDVTHVIVNALGKGLTRSQISGVVGVSPRAITRISTNLRKYGTPKAPSKGLKLGRPARMSRSQAEAMVSWMEERSNEFYVKDLVTFLKENYSYKGCDGTVRRSIIRAGYKKKLPWHRSELTKWISPPDGPKLAVINDEEQDDHLEGEGEDEPTTRGNESQQQNSTTLSCEAETEPQIDPELVISLNNHSTFRASPDTQLPNGDEQTTIHNRPRRPTLQIPERHSYISASSKRNSIQQNSEVHQSSKRRKVSSQSTGAENIDPSLTSAPDTSIHRHRPDQITSLQNTVAEQKTLIDHLREQLARQSHPPPLPQLQETPPTSIEPDDHVPRSTPQPPLAQDHENSVPPSTDFSRRATHTRSTSSNEIASLQPTHSQTSTSTYPTLTQTHTDSIPPQLPRSHSFPNQLDPPSFSRSHSHPDIPHYQVLARNSSISHLPQPHINESLPPLLHESPPPNRPQSIPHSHTNLPRQSSPQPHPPLQPQPLSSCFRPRNPSLGIQRPARRPTPVNLPQIETDLEWSKNSSRRLSQARENAQHVETNSNAND